MLNALSSTLKNESDDQSRNAPPTIPSAVAFAWIAAHRAQDRVERRARERLRELADEERALVGLVRRARAARATGRAAARTRAARSTRSSPRGACRGRRRTCSGLAPRAAVCSQRVDAAQALADLTEISPQVGDVAIDRRGRLRVGLERSPTRRRAERFAERREAAASRPTRREARGLRTSPSSRRRRSTAASSSCATATRLIAATTTPEPTVGLVFYDLKHCLRSIDEPPKPAAAQARPRRRRPTMPPRKVVTGVLLAAGSLAGSVLVPPPRRAPRERVDLYAEDGSMHSLRRRLARGGPPAADRARAARRVVTHGDELAARAPRRGLPRGRLRPPLGPPLEVLPRQVPLRDAPRPAAAARRGDRRRRRASTSRTRCGSRRPSSARSPLAAAASLEAGLPFVIVRKEAKDYGTAQPARGRLRAGRVRLPRRGRRHLRRRGARGGRGAPRGRAAGLERGLRRRPRGGRRRRARAPRRAAAAALRAPRSSWKAPQIRMVERYPTALLGCSAKV